MVLPTYKVKPEHIATIRDYTRRLGLALNVRGLMNVQYAIKDDKVYVIEVNPRASRTVPFISKATGVPMAKIAAKIASGRTLGTRPHEDLDAKRYFVKDVGAALREVPGQRHPPRPRDEVDGRGDGRRAASASLSPRRRRVRARRFQPAAPSSCP
jgi:biotin carboxylase